MRAARMFAAVAAAACAFACAAVTVTVDPRAKTLRFGEALTAGSEYQVSVAGCEEASVAGAVLALQLGGETVAAAALSSGGGTLSLRTRELAMEFADMRPGVRVPVFAKLTDAAAEQTYAVGKADVISVGREWMDTTVLTNVTVARRYAMFILPMKFHGDAVTYCDVELKASVANFSAATDSTSRCTFWCHTSRVPTATNDSCRIYALNVQGEDARAWTRLEYASDVPASEASPELVLIVSPDCCTRTNGRWLYELNEEIVWSYVRCTASGREETARGAAMWRPCAPARWFASLPAWAGE